MPNKAQLDEFSRMEERAFAFRKKIISRNEIYDELMHARYVLWFIAFFPSNFELFAYFLKRKTQHRTKMKPITVKLHTFSCRNSLKIYSRRKKEMKLFGATNRIIRLSRSFAFCLVTFRQKALDKLSQI